MAEIKLGTECQDRISKFRGIAIARTTYLQGCNRILLQPQVDTGVLGLKSGDRPEPQHFDEPDLIVVGKGIWPAKLPEPDDQVFPPPGGPRPFALRKSF